MHSSSAMQANEYEYRRERDKKIAKSYDMMGMFMGGQRKYNTYNDDVSGGTDNLRFYSGSSQNNNSMSMAQKVEKLYKAMDIVIRGR